MLKTLYDKTKEQLAKYKTSIEDIQLRKRSLSNSTQSLSENSKDTHKSVLDTKKQTENKKEPEKEYANKLEEDIFCRICYSHESPTGSMTDLVSPCGCKGTIKYVHRYCLKIWRFKGKRVKDIKVCEQCFCEYVVDDEKNVGQFIVGISTAAIIMSFLIATSLFITSSADTASFITNDIYAYFYGNVNMISFENPIIICNMDLVVAEKNSQNPNRSRKYILKKIENIDKKTDHFANIKKGYLYNIKNIHMIDLKNGNAFTSTAVFGCAYTVAFEDSPFLFVNFILSFWRIISFGGVVDWILYVLVMVYIYCRIFEKIFLYIDNYCMYVANFY